MTAAAKVLIVDDEPPIRRLLAAILRRGGFDPVEAGSAREALSLREIVRPVAVLLDLGLADRDGIELVAALRAVESGRLALIVVSARQSTAEKVAALDLGADDYVTKPFDGDELLARLRAAIRQHAAASTGGTTVRSGRVEIDLVARSVRRDGREVRLPPREYELLAELARFPGRVLTHRHLLASVWGNAHVDDVAYLRVAARGLRRKLENDPANPRMIRNEPSVGYRLVMLPETSA